MAPVHIPNFHLKSLFPLSVILHLSWSSPHLHNLYSVPWTRQQFSPPGPLHILFPIPGHFSIGSLLALFLLKFQSSVYILLLLRFLPWLLCRSHFPHYLLKLHSVSLLISILITICNYVFGFLIVSLITKLSSKIAGTTSVLIINICLYNSRYLIKTCWINEENLESANTCPSISPEYYTYYIVISTQEVETE